MRISACASWDQSKPSKTYLPQGAVHFETSSLRSVSAISVMQLLCGQALIVCRVSAVWGDRLLPYDFASASVIFSILGGDPWSTLGIGHDVLICGGTVVAGKASSD